jgi:hypothetical protein
VNSVVGGHRIDLTWSCLPSETVSSLIDARSKPNDRCLLIRTQPATLRLAVHARAHSTKVGISRVRAGREQPQASKTCHSPTVRVVACAIAGVVPAYGETVVACVDSETCKPFCTTLEPSPSPAMMREADHSPPLPTTKCRREGQSWVMLSLSALLSTMSSEFPTPNHGHQADSVAAQYLHKPKILHQYSGPAFTRIAIRVVIQADGGVGSP